jgi:hypothetical protein
MKKKTTKKEPIIAIINIIQDRYLNTIFSRRLASKLFKLFLILFGKRLPKITNKYDENKTFQNELEEQGITVLPSISDEILDEIKDFSLKAALYDPWADRESIFYYNSVPEGTKLGRVANPLDCESLTNLIYDERILDLMARQFKSKFVMDSVELWWSFPTKEAAAEAENYHRDTDSLEFYKHFIYLTDVCMESGPHTYIPTTNKTSDFFTHERFLDESVDNAYPNARHMVGPAGTNFIANTTGIHKALKPKSNIRLLLQVRFSLHGSSFRYKGPKHSFSNLKSDLLWKDYLAKS